MALINLHVFSNSLQMQTEIEVVIPQKDKCGEIGVNGKVENKKTCGIYCHMHSLTKIDYQ
jgi:hypothetical protein